MSAVVALFLACLVFVGGHAYAQGNPYASEADRIGIQRELDAHGTSTVIVDLKQIAEGAPAAADDAKAAEVNKAKVREVVARLNLANVQRTLPLSASFSAEVTRAELERLLADPGVLRIAHDRRLGIRRTAGSPQFPPVVSRSLQIVGASTIYYSYGEGGEGSIIAIIDSGVDGEHPSLAGRIVDEHCFSTQSNGYDSTCRGRQAEDFGPGAARPCVQRPACDHGTAVASVAAGYQVLPGWAGPYSDTRTSLFGVAPLSYILPVQVMSLPRDGGAPTALVSDIRAALQFVYLKRNAFPGQSIVAANISLNDVDDLRSVPCDTDGLAQDVVRLRNAGVATVISAGNQSDKTRVAWPACVTDAISVASVNLSDQPSSFSNFSSLVDFFAPGESIDVAVPGEPLPKSEAGTSFAAPHVAGAFAVFRSWTPVNDRVSELSRILRDSGKPITIGTLERKRIDLVAAFQVASPNRLFVSGPQVGEIEFCQACANREVYLSVTKGVADWVIQDAPSWLEISGKSGQAPNVLTLFRGSGFETLPFGTTGSIRIRNLSAQQSDLVLTVRKTYPEPAQPSNFRLEQPAPTDRPLPWANVISSDVVVGADGRVLIMWEGFPPSVRGQSERGNERLLYGVRGENWRVEGLPPWLRAYPPQGGFFGGVNWERVAFTNSGLDSAISRLEPGREYRASFSIVKVSEPSKPIEMTAVIHVTQPATADLFAVVPAGGLLFQGKQGGPFSAIASSLSLNRAGGDPHWEIYDLPEWLRASAISGSAPATISFALTAAAERLPVGEYSTYVVFRNRTGYQRAVARSVSLIVAPK